MRDVNKERMNEWSLCIGISGTQFIEESTKVLPSENSTHAMTPVSDKIAPPPPNGSVFVAGWHPTAPIAVPLTMIPELEGVGFGR